MRLITKGADFPNASYSCFQLNTVHLLQTRKKNQYARCDVADMGNNQLLV